MEFRRLTADDINVVMAIVQTHNSSASMFYGDDSKPDPGFPGSYRDYLTFCLKPDNRAYVGFGVYEDGVLLAVQFLIRWRDNENFTLGFRVTLKSLGVFNTYAVDVMNYALGWFRSEGLKYAWTNYRVGYDTKSLFYVSNCMLSTYTRELITTIPANTPWPEQYQRVNYPPLPYDAEIYRFTDPEPLETFYQQEE